MHSVTPSSITYTYDASQDTLTIGDTSVNLEFKSKGSPSVVEALGGIHGVAFISDIKAAVGKILPDVPNDDGTYTLQCTVDDGVAAYRWV